MFITEQNGTQMWTKMLKENFNVTDNEKLAWVSEYANIHQIKESALGVGGANIGVQYGATAPVNGVNPLYATPLNTTGFGDPAAPGAPTLGASAEFFHQSVGSGDVPVSTLPMALNVALLTIGLELVPVIPAKGPWAMLTYMDFPYAGGKLGRKNEVANLDGIGAGAENKPLYFKVLGTVAAEADKQETLRGALREGVQVTFRSGDAKADGVYRVTGMFKCWGRMDGGMILQTKEVVTYKNGKAVDASLKAAFRALAASNATVIKVTDVTAKDADMFEGYDANPHTGARVLGDVLVDDLALSAKALRVDFAQTMVDFVDGFANFATGTKRSMTRGENETGTGNVIGLRLFSKWVQMGSYEVTGTVTRQQLQDLPLYGVDAVSKVMEAMQNEITQSINARILEHVFALGTTNARNQFDYQRVNLNLYMGTAASRMVDNPKYTDIYGRLWNTTVVNSEVNTSAENLHTRQRRIASRVLAAANLIQTVGRRGRATWIVTNAQVATALQDVSGYVVAPMVNGMAQDGSQNLFLGGTLAGLKVYVDPYMDWDDTRICVGRKGNGNEPGVVFMPYILADTVSITAEGTMAPKMLVNSRYALVDAGFYPETQYYTFTVESDFGLI